MNNKRVEQIKDSILKTIQDPNSPDARKADCYASCAKFINKYQSEDYSVVIYGYEGYPFHGIVINNKNNEILIDTFESKRVERKDNEITYNDGNKEIKLSMIEKMDNSLWKNMINEIEMPDVVLKSKESVDKNTTPRNKIKPQ